MDKEKQRVAIAEFCGWTGSFGMYRQISSGKNLIGGPDYLNDLNAIQEAVLSLPEELHHNYMGYLGNIIDLKKNKDVFYMHNATAAQRSEALLKTIGKWEE